MQYRMAMAIDNIDNYMTNYSINAIEKWYDLKNGLAHLSIL